VAESPPGFDAELHRRSGFSTERFAAIRDVQNPLGFFVLLLLVMDTFFALVGIFAPLPEWARISFLAAAFLATVAFGFAVYWLVVKHPAHLVFTERAHLRVLEMRYGSGWQPLSPDALDSLPPVQPPIPPVGQLPAGQEEP
jgi:hypothetical protein